MTSKADLFDCDKIIKWIEKHCRIPEAKDIGMVVKLRPWQRPHCAAMSGPSDQIDFCRSLLPFAVDHGLLGRRAPLAVRMPSLDDRAQIRPMRSGPIAETGQGRAEPIGLWL